MNKNIEKFIKLLTDSNYRQRKLIRMGIYNSLSDEEYLKKRFKIEVGMELNLNTPRTFNEKLQWLKLYDHKPEYTAMVDKYEVKKYITQMIGEEYVIPTLGVWDEFDDIDFDVLPDQFVLKCTHDSGGLVICRDKKIFNRAKARKKIEKSLKNNFFYSGREWAYKDVKPRIIAEKYMEDYETQELRDYKFFCFNGICKALFIASDRQTDGVETKFDFFDSNYNHLDINNGHPNANVIPEKPKNFELMKQLAEKLSAGIPHLRVDFYEVNGKAYFGELTFCHWSGMVPFEPIEWDYKFGEWIELPEKTI